MATVAGLLQKLSKDDSWIDDSTDRAIRRYVVIVVSFQLLVVYGGGFLRGNPIQCFTPKYFTGPQEKYSESLCWLESSQHLSYIIEPSPGADPGDVVPDIGKLGFYNRDIYRTTGGKSGYVGLNTPGQRINVSYYQWVPIYLIFVALFSYLPFLAWKTVTLKCGLPLKSMVNAAKAMSDVNQKGMYIESVYCKPPGIPRF